MRLAGKVALGGIVIALAGTGIGFALGSGSTREDHPSSSEAPAAVVLERRERDGVREPGEVVAMVSTRPAPSAPASVERTSRPAETRELERGRDARGGLRVRRIEVATGIEAREPVGASERFARDEERLYVFLDLANSGDAAQVEVSFEPETPSRDAVTTGLVELDVPAEARRHRTWAWSRNVHAPGAWSAVVRDLDGRELARTDFVVE